MPARKFPVSPSAARDSLISAGQVNCPRDGDRSSLTLRGMTS